MKLKPISEQVVVLMGASSGIGRQAALDFAKRGARVVVAARGEEGLASLIEEIRSAGGEARAFAADTSDFHQVKSLADRAAEIYGRIDTWVHCAAVSIYATFEQTTAEEFRRIVDVNLNGQAYGAMAALPHLRNAGGGALIHISSVEARRGLPFQSAYAASKHGITGFLESLRLELKQEGVPISVTEIIPSAINTPLFNKARTKLGVKPMGLQPIYQPQLVADAILYAAEHPIRDFVVGGAGKAMKMTQELLPGLADQILLRIGFEGQKTDEAKPETAPDNLYAPMRGYNQVQGDFSDKASGRTIFNWISKNPIASKAVALCAVVAALAFTSIFAPEARE
jgi:NAD(P)-dependent dehydrogenase (short-subunit alcohol dehydrogenase family)